jgi:flagellar hook protein FlgE
MISVIRSGMDAALQKLDVTSNNIANARTTGFKRREAMFTDMYSSAIASSTGDRLGIGVQAPEIRMSQKQGNLQKTNAVLDLAIEGEGMFTLRNMNEVQSFLYTRDGSFTIDSEGEIATTEGYKVLSSNGNAITVPMRAAVAVDVNGVEELGMRALTGIAVQPDGAVEATYGGNQIFVVARIGVSNFADSSSLTPIGNNMFRDNSKSGAGVIGGALKEGRGKIYSGALEMANTDITEELSNMIRAQQAFSGSSRLLQSEMEMFRKLV